MHFKCVAAAQLPELKFVTELEEKREKQGNIQCFRKRNPFPVVYLFLIFFHFAK